ncbi:hypothetical protein GCM10011321_28280 [Youhaiella tibetensis]|uniref:PD-(D/E)XK motif protein n=1 Tax=Paradevosia tibetensis TaxID=1447062 RepID=A0A5B9DLB0_9HYPH|nr:PD-(D/E)XK motif protein [Youhaiella tibetensis]QEE19178.1 PD-(D/E)XK motif protein [Youhaiella tibetensis]GGF35539.1 hypothetical protein GCM10011321_28280 [Youhaiella tibetensis]
MPEASPWDGISVPAHTDYTVRQVPGPTAVPCFWGRDRSGACLFILDLDGDHTDQYRKNTTTINGIDVDLRGEAGRQRLVLTLEEQIDRDLFGGLCSTLIAALGNASDAPTSLAVALAHIRRWKTFLSGRAAHHLTPEQVRGLFAELVFLEEMLDRGGTAPAAVQAWLGPEMSHQDFIFGNTAVEIKSLSGTERSTVRISSEDQLESLNDNLFLRVYRLSDLPDAAGARSLNDQVVRIQARLAAPEQIESFDRKLVLHRYAPLPEYDAPLLVVSAVRTFRVAGDNFPRLARSGLPEGVARVAYDIRIEALAPFECDNDLVFGGGNG